MSQKIIYFEGDATYPKTTGKIIIAHICNDVGAWGSGFVMDISARWDAPAEAYRNWHKNGSDFKLGEIQLVPVTDDMTVANMIAQHGLKGADNPRPIRYGALQYCLKKLAQHAKAVGAQVHMPRIGTGRAGGKWGCIEPLIENELIRHGIPVYVYDKEVGGI